MESTWPVSNKKFEDHANDSTIHITASDKINWNGKADGTHTHTATSLGAIGWPDYSNAKKIRILVDYPYEVTENGWISVACSGYGRVTVNDVIVAICNTYTNNAWMYAQQSVFPVSKGDIVETTSRDRTENVWFIPCK